MIALTLHRAGPSAGPAASPTKRRSPTAGFWIAGIIAVAGLLGAVVWAAFGAFGAVTGTNDLARAPLPASVTTEVARAGTVVVYYEGAPVPSLTQLGVDVADPAGDSVPVSDYAYDLQYEAPALPGVVGRAVATFEAAAPGSYVVTSRYDPTGVARLAVGDNVATSFLQRMVGPVLLAAVAFSIAVVVAVMTAARRTRPR